MWLMTCSEKQQLYGVSIACAQKSVLPIESGKNSATSSQTQFLFSLRTSAITSMPSKEFQGVGCHSAPGGGASSRSRGRGITQLVTYNRVGGVEGEVTSGYLTT